MADHPVCAKCGSREFQLVEDVPRVFRVHKFFPEGTEEFDTGVLVFNPDIQSMCWDGCGGHYQYVECRKCQTKLEDENVNFEFGDDITLEEEEAETDGEEE